MLTVLKYLDDAITELDTMQSVVSSYKIHLNVSAFATHRHISFHSVISYRLSATTLHTFKVRAAVSRFKREINGHS